MSKMKGKRFRLTLRWRLALWTATMLSLSGIALIAVINGLAVAVFPTVSIANEGSLNREAQRDTQQKELHERSQLPLQESETASAPLLTPHQMELTNDHSFELVPQEAVQQQTIEKALDDLIVISVVSLSGVVVLGSVGAYWLAKKPLKPIKQLSERIAHIRPDSFTRLDEQLLPTDGPDDEMKQLAQSFNAMLTRLEDVFQHQYQFVSSASHELRTPLSVMQTNVEVQLDDDEATAEDYRATLYVLKRQVARLNCLVDELLHLSRRDIIRREQRIDIAQMLAEVTTELSPLAAERQVGVSLHADEAAVCLGQRDLLHRALSNIVENAICYNRLNGKVTITVKCQRECKQLLLTISDTGVGIPADDVRVVFEPFYRADRSRARHSGGTGLGLAIAKLIVERHEGTITVNSDSRGSSFTIVLPLADAVP